MRTRPTPLPSLSLTRALLVCLMGALAGCGPRSLVDRAREVGAIDSPAARPPSASPTSAAPSSTPAAAPVGLTGAVDATVFDGCAGRRVDAANEFIGCKAFLASAHRAVGYTVEAALETLIQDARHSKQSARSREVTDDAITFKLDDRVLDGRRYSVTYADGSVDEHIAVALKGRSDKVLLAHCAALSDLGQTGDVIDDACRNALATILNGMVPANIYLAPEPYADGTVAGRALKTPDGCEREGKAQRIRCGEAGQLSWYQARTSLVPLAVVARAKTEAITASARSEGVSVTAAGAIDCTVEGVETKCVHHRLDIDGEPSVHFYQAKVDVRGETLYALCSGAGAAPDKPVPSPCEQVFKW